MAYSVDNRGEKQTYLAIESKKFPFPRISILVSQHTASAAELFAQALTNLLPTVQLIGRTTHGKCTSQRVHPLANGGLLKWTNMNLLNARGEFCHGLGLSPHLTLSQEQLLNTPLLMDRILHQKPHAPPFSCLEPKPSGL